MENGDHNSAEDADDKPLDGWVKIQHSTFTNWANDKLRSLGIILTDLRHDFKDGVKLNRLLQVLRGQPTGRLIIKDHINLLEANGNIGLALATLQKDGIKLVNIGN